jgi:hypothetical protein
MLFSTNVPKYCTASVRGSHHKPIAQDATLWIEQDNDHQCPPSRLPIAARKTTVLNFSNTRLSSSLCSDQDRFRTFGNLAVISCVRRCATLALIRARHVPFCPGLATREFVLGPPAGVSKEFFTQILTSSMRQLIPQSIHVSIHPLLLHTRHSIRKMVIFALTLANRLPLPPSSSFLSFSSLFLG